MYLARLSILNFKNHEDSSLELSNNINCFVGNNGSGKTNLLDAIHYLSFTKSYFNSQDALNIKHEQPFLSVEGQFNKDGKEEMVHCVIKRGAKKVMKRNKKSYERLADHIGLFPLVMISPTDTNLILEGSEARRKYLDAVISQFDRAYLEQLIQYGKLIAQRNAVLKQMAKGGRFDNSTLDLYDEQIIPIANHIFEKRKSFLEDLLPVFRAYYRNISGNNEEVTIEYKSKLLDASLVDLMLANRERDKLLQYTSVGIHKDDLLFQLDGFPIKKIGSQGQQKTFLMAIKLAQFDFMQAALGYKPMLLLDDVFDKLDENRVEHLMTLVDQHHFGQIFITDTSPERSVYIFNKIQADFKVFHVKEGTIEKEE
ncbi:MAG: DNA replication and repair protein RecF [Flavobacteriales bacterium]|nr:DNA replication and repair protein RecF [Flavobacteriales bacterium]|tara:strand:- start:3655 stop:4761 length:1107 start_codon:yes stop_codon:yes gene_type:complete